MYDAEGLITILPEPPLKGSVNALEPVALTKISSPTVVDLFCIATDFRFEKPSDILLPRTD